jgi:hypothetical protein
MCGGGKWTRFLLVKGEPLLKEIYEGNNLGGSSIGSYFYCGRCLYNKRQPTIAIEFQKMH